jgi:hypothetical protein
MAPWVTAVMDRLQRMLVWLLTESLVVDGQITIADKDNQRIRRVDSATGIITTIAGNGIQGFGGDWLQTPS